MDVLAVLLGLAVGVSLGALGGGGSTLAVPILVFVAGLGAQEATTASLLVVGIAAVVGAVGHYRAGNVRLRAGLVFAAVGIVGSRVGTTLNQRLDGDVLLLGFAVLIAFVALRMYRQAPSEPPIAVEPPTVEPPTTLSAADGGPGEPTGPAGVAVLTSTTTDLDLSPASVGRLVAAATTVGLLTGLFGVGGGFAVVPALTILLGFSTRDAIGTSLVVIGANALIALGMRAGDLRIDWGLALPFLAMVTVGVVAGSALGKRVDATRLTRAFAVMLLVVAVYTALGALLG